MKSDTALFEVVLAAHILCAVVGFGSICVTGGYASLARPRPGRDVVPDSVRRYFRPGLNWASQVIFLVPLLGLVLSGMNGGHDLARPWLWVGSGLWLAAAGLAFAVVWPAERRIGSVLAGAGKNANGRATGGPGEAGSCPLAGPARRAAVGAGAIDIVVLAAFVVMVARPGG